MENGWVTRWAGYNLQRMVIRTTNRAGAASDIVVEEEKICLQGFEYYSCLNVLGVKRTD